MRRDRASVLGALSLLALLEVAAAAIPPRRAGETVLYDQAGLLEWADREAVEAAQARAFRAHGVPITVVTIERMTEVVPDADVDSLARQWLEAWGPEQAGASRGILLLVSRADRAVRIELGREWGRGFDREAGRILHDVVLARFRDGNHSSGIRSGVDALEQLAARGPRGRPAGGGADEALETVLATGRFPTRIAAPLGLLGVVLVLLSFFLPQYRNVLLIAGFTCIAVALFTLIFFAVIWIVMGFRRRGRGYRGDYGGGSRGGSGGSFGGGGGASGSW